MLELIEVSLGNSLNSQAEPAKVDVIGIAPVLDSMGIPGQGFWAGSHDYKSAPHTRCPLYISILYC